MDGATDISADKGAQTGAAERLRTQLGEAVYDASRRTVELRGTEAALEPRLAEILDALLRADAAVSRSDLMDAAWGPGEGSDEALTQAISKLRRALGDDARPYRVIETAPKFGYRLIASAAAAPDSRPARDDEPAPAPQSNGLLAFARRRREFLAGLATGILAMLLCGAILLAAFGRQTRIEVTCEAGDDPESCARMLESMHATIE